MLAGRENAPALVEDVAASGDGLQKFEQRLCIPEADGADGYTTTHDRCPMDPENSAQDSGSKASRSGARSIACDSAARN